MTERRPRNITRREVLLASAAGVALGCVPAGSPGEDREMTSSQSRMPVVFLPHGGGPWPFVDLGMGDPAELAALADYLRGLGQLSPRPRQLLVISAHWEEPVPSVMTSAAPPMRYDYYGFPPESYEITWPAPGDPALAQRVRSLLSDAGIESGANPTRGFDHGTFVPLKLSYPNADVPVVQLSLRSDLDPERHLAVGRALAPLRDQGVLIVGSGMSYHNMRGFRTGAGRADARVFDAWLQEAVRLPRERRDEALRAWAAAPAGRASHPREEHLLPLMVVAGAAGDDPASVPFSADVLGTRVSAVHFG